MEKPVDITPEEHLATRAASDIEQVVEKGAKNSPVEDITWETQTGQTDLYQIRDPGAGKPVILRHFFFKALPKLEGQPNPSKKDIVSHFKRLIEMSLWGDGLIIREDRPLEVQTLKGVRARSTALHQKMVQEGADFVILCLAEPRMGQTVVDQPRIAL